MILHKCLYCGRFARFHKNRREANSNYDWIVISWTCTKCGYCEEETQSLIKNRARAKQLLDFSGLERGDMRWVDADGFADCRDGWIFA